MNKEILLVAEAVSNEKGVNKEIIFEAIEAALAMATKRKNGRNWDIRVNIDPETGDYVTHRIRSVVPDDVVVENPEHILFIDEAKEIDPSLEIGDELREEIESVEFGRIAAQTAKQVIVQKVREAERAKVVAQFQSRIGELVNGTVKRVTRDVIFVEIGPNAEAILPRDQMIPKEIIRMNDRIKAFLKEVRIEGRGPQLILSRVAPGMLIELFKIEVPEVSEGIIEILSVARDPGSRAKIAVKTNDGRIDPIGACVGMRGSRVQAISSELGGERVDIVLWDEDPVKFVINSMAPAEVLSIMMNEEKKVMTVVVSEEQLSQAIGRSGQNARLAGMLTGWKINILTETQAASDTEKSQENEQVVLQRLIDSLEIDDEMAQVLIDEGFSRVEDIAHVDSSDLLEIEGFDEDIVDELQDRAKQYLLTQAIVAGNDKPAQDLLDLPGMTSDLATKFAKAGIITREDLAEMSIDELTENNLVDAVKASELIMQARKHWFE